MTVVAVRSIEVQLVPEAAINGLQMKKRNETKFSEKKRRSNKRQLGHCKEERLAALCQISEPSSRFKACLQNFSCEKIKHQAGFGYNGIILRTRMVNGNKSTEC